MKLNWKIVLLLLVVNLIVSVGATLGVLYYWENVRNVEKPYTLVIDNQNEPIAAAPTFAVDYAIVATASPDAADPAQPTAEPGQDTPPTRDQLVSITAVIGMGDVNTESVSIISNTDTVVMLDKWTIEDADGAVFTFPNIQLMRKGYVIPLYTRNGHNTPYELYWGLPNAVWQSGETVVLKDDAGNIQSTYRIP